MRSSVAAESGPAAADACGKYKGSESGLPVSSKKFRRVVTADQEHPAPAVTAIVPLPPVAANAWPPYGSARFWRVRCHRQNRCSVACHRGDYSIGDLPNAIIERAVGDVEVAATIHCDAERFGEASVGCRTIVAAEKYGAVTGDRRNHAIGNLADPVVAGVGDV